MLNQFTFEAQDAVAAPPLLIAHGLYGSARNWGVMARWLSINRRVITVDMRNHAGSFWDNDHSYEALGAELAEVSTQEGPMDVIGHSMGGKAARVAALEGAAITRLVVADIAPVFYHLCHLAMIDAMRSVDLSTIQSRTDADLRLAESVDEKSVRAFLLQSLDMKTKTWKLFEANYS